MSNPHHLNGATERNSLGTTTLCIKSLAGELRRDEILSHFSAFGDVKNVRICAFVEFTQAESVAKALKMEFHTIAGRRVEVTIADDETTFLDLNDDCIHEILSMECLSALDLCSVAETSRRMKEIAVRVFKRKHSKCDLNSLARDEAKSAQRILRNFGAMISDLEICGDDFEDNWTRVLDSVATHCSNTLESLNLRGCVIPDNFTAKFRPIFNNLQKLTIRECAFEGASKELFADCGPLVELELEGRDVGFIVENTFPKLQKFKCHYSTDGMNLDSFTLRHKNLTSISIWLSFEMSSLLASIRENCKLLEELEFSIRGDKTYDLSNLGQLRKLKICCYNPNVKEAVRGWNNWQFLENLTLRSANVDSEFIETLSQLKSLQVLRLAHCYGLENWNRIGDLNQLIELEIESRENVDFDFVLLIKRLSNLKALSVEGRGLKVDSETYSRIVNVIRTRTDHSKLTFRRRHMHHIFSLNSYKVEMIIGN